MRCWRDVLWLVGAVAAVAVAMMSLSPSAAIHQEVERWTIRGVALGMTRDEVLEVAPDAARAGRSLLLYADGTTVAMCNRGVHSIRAPFIERNGSIILMSGASASEVRDVLGNGRPYLDYPDVYLHRRGVQGVVVWDMPYQRLYEIRHADREACAVLL